MVVLGVIIDVDVVVFIGVGCMVGVVDIIGVVFLCQIFGISGFELCFIFLDYDDEVLF